MKIEPSDGTAPEVPLVPSVAPPVEITPGKQSLGPWGVLRNRNYALLFWGQLISSSGTQMQVVAVAWQVLLLTHNPVALGLVGVGQAIPRLIFSLVGGVLADMIDRRKMLIIIEVVLASMSAVLALCTIFNFINIFV